MDKTEGLSQKEAARRLEKWGENKLPQEASLSGVKLFLRQFQSPLVYILLAVAAVVFWLEDYPQNIWQSFFILAAVLVNAGFGFWEENKASRIFEELQKVLKTRTTVVRDGRKKEILQEEVVPGDIIVFAAGDKIPADAKLLEARNLKVSEAVLTGEWLAVEKDIHQENEVFAGSLVEEGEGWAVVEATGENTRAGEIALLVKETEEEKTPLQKKLARFSQRLGGIILIMTLFIFVGGFVRQRDPLEMLETAAAVAVGGIPEALPVVMTLTLALGMKNLSRKKGLVRRLSAVETLGSTSLICFDKTKTLTQGRMEPYLLVTPEKDFPLDSRWKHPTYLRAMQIAALANQAFVEDSGQVRGTPTDRALLQAGRQSGISKDKLEKEFPPVDHLTFDPALKYQASLHQENGGLTAFVSGAPEKLLETASIGPEAKGRLGEKLDQMTQKGDRVVGLGWKKISDPQEKWNLEGLTLVGFLAFRDPLREGAAEAVKVAQEAGIGTIIITGDHQQTAAAIAERVGIKASAENILRGKDLEALTDQELEDRIKEIKIYARAEPKHKIRIVRAWQKKGRVVAMVGDGVNDSPALKKADIGVALGSGTEVAKQASDIVLLEDGFEVVIAAVKQGRVILDNLRKAIGYILADSFTSVILVGSGVLLGWPLPILWPQILWNNLVEDTPPNIAYAFEPQEDNVMRRGPNPPNLPLLTREMKVLIFFTGLVDEFLTLGLFWFLWQVRGAGLDYARTMAFGALCVDTAFVVYAYKNLRKNIWQINLLDNRFLLISSLLVLAFFAAAIYLPPLQTVLHTVPLGLGDWLTLSGVGVLSLLLIELTKYFFIARRDFVIE